MPRPKQELTWREWCPRAPANQAATLQASHWRKIVRFPKRLPGTCKTQGKSIGKSMPRPKHEITWREWCPRASADQVATQQASHSRKINRFQKRQPGSCQTQGKSIPQMKLRRDEGKRGEKKKEKKRRKKRRRKRKRRKGKKEGGDTAAPAEFCGQSKNCPLPSIFLLFVWGIST